MKRTLLLLTVITGLSQIGAQVSYHDFDPDEEIHATYAGESINIDFDGDQNPEINIYGTKHDTTFSGFPVTLTGFAMTTFGNTEIAGGTALIGTETVLEADTLLAGNTIDGALSYVNSSTPSIFPGVGLSADASGFADAGKYSGAGFKYVGVQFEISGSTHYGWVRLSVNATHDTCIVDAYGYEATAATAIDAGDMGAGTVGVSEFASEAAVIVQEGVFRLSNLSGSNVTIYNILGEVEMSSRVTSENVQLNASRLTSGVYLIACTKGTQVITFKVYKP